MPVQQHAPRRFRCCLQRAWTSQRAVAPEAGAWQTAPSAVVWAPSVAVGLSVAMSAAGSPRRGAEQEVPSSLQVNRS